MRQLKVLSLVLASVVTASVPTYGLAGESADEKCLSKSPGPFQFDAPTIQLLRAAIGEEEARLEKERENLLKFREAVFQAKLQGNGQFIVTVPVGLYGVYKLALEESSIYREEVQMGKGVVLIAAAVGGGVIMKFREKSQLEILKQKISDAEKKVADSENSLKKKGDLLQAQFESLVSQNCASVSTFGGLKQVHPKLTTPGDRDAATAGGSSAAPGK